MFLNFSRGIARSIFMTARDSASTSNGRIFASLRLFSLSPLPNDCGKCAACFLYHHFQSK